MSQETRLVVAWPRKFPLCQGSALLTGDSSPRNFSWLPVESQPGHSASESWSQPLHAVCEVWALGRCLSPYARGDLTRPNGQPGQRLSGGAGFCLEKRTAAACPAGLAWPLLPGEETAAAIADAKQRKIFLKLQHLAPWQPSSAGGLGVLESPLGTSHGLASDYCLGRLWELSWGCGAGDPWQPHCWLWPGTPLSVTSACFWVFWIFLTSLFQK